MTIAIDQRLPLPTATREKFHMARKNLLKRLWEWYSGEKVLGPGAKHIDMTEDTPVLDPVLVDDPLDDAWVAPPGEEMPLIIGDQMGAEFQAEHKRPLDTTWTPAWALSYTGYLQAIQGGKVDEPTIEVAA